MRLIDGLLELFAFACGLADVKAKSTEGFRRRVGVQGDDGIEGIMEMADDFEGGRLEGMPSLG